MGIANVIRHILYAVLVAGLSGSIAFIITIFIGKIWYMLNPSLQLSMYKCAVILGLVPVLLPIIYFQHISFKNGYWIFRGNLLDAAPNSLGVVCISSFLGGLIGCVIYFVILYASSKKLKVLLDGNVPIEKESWIRIVEEYKEKYSVKNIEVLQNDLLASPITIGGRNPKVIIPYGDFDDKYFHMMLEHEIHHIVNRDVMWKKTGVVSSAIHWCNITMHYLFSYLGFQEEVVCDLDVSYNREHYTQKEYIQFLVDLSDNKWRSNNSASFCDVKDSTLKRAKCIMRFNRLVKPAKGVTAVVLTFLIIASLVPTYVVADQFTELEQKYVESKTEKYCMEYVTPDGYTMYTRLPGDLQDDITEYEIFLDDIEVMSSRKMVTIDVDLPPKSRTYFEKKEYNGRTEIPVLFTCDPDNIEFEVGFKNVDTLVETYLYATHIVNTNLVTYGGRQRIYVQNNDPDRTIHIEGAVYYPY